MTENELIIKAKDGNQSAIKALIKMHYWLIFETAKKYHIENHDLDDLLQLAMMGFLASIKPFDINNGTKFTTYAMFSIRALLSNKFQRTKAKRRDVAITSLDVVINDDSQDTLMDLIPVDCDNEIDHDYSKLIMKCMKSIGPAKHKMMFMLMLQGYLHDDDSTLKDMGEIIGVGRERARQIREEFKKNRAFIELRRELVA